MKAMLSALGSAALALLLAVAPAGAEIQPPHQLVTIGFPTRNGFFVYATLHPQKRVVVFGAQTGVEDPSSGVWSSTSYVKRVPRRSFGDVVHVDLGPLGRIDGRFVPDRTPHVGHLNRFCRGRRPISETGHFAGRVVFKGDGAYLSASTHRAPIAIVARTFRLHCKKGHAADFENSRPGLFAYAQASTDFLSNSDGTYLRAISRAENLVTEFMAIDHLRDDTVGFKAVAREWLPDGVATSRSIEVERAPRATFVLGEPEQDPESAVVHPPTPFNGAVEYTRSLGFLDGDLSASFLGKDLSLAGPDSEIEICARPDPRELWRCD